MNKTITSVILLAALAAYPALADDVTLRDGTVLQGKITIETPARIVLQQTAGKRILVRSDVLSIESKPFALPSAQATFAVDRPVSSPAGATSGPAVWPPRIGEAYPDFTLRDSTGALVKLSSLKGKVILVEPVGMTCHACQAFSGGQALGGFQGIEPQAGLDSLESYVARFGNGLTMADPNLVYVQIVVFDMNLKAPSLADVKAWADHFKLSGRPNVLVLQGTPEMASQASFSMIPGIHLVDRDFVLRSEYFGHGGGNDLYRELIPMAGRLASTTN